MAISSTFSLLDISDWWGQQEERHMMYPNLPNVACNIFSIIPHGVGVEARFSLGCDGVSKRQSKTTCKTPRQKVMVRLFPQANNRMLACDDPALDTMNTEYHSEVKREGEE